MALQNLLMEGVMFVVLVLIVVGIAALFYFASKKPGIFEVERFIIIEASPATIFPHITTLRNWKAWSPYERLDPAMAQTYSGPDSGAGAKMAWAGNRKAGSGSVTITEIERDARVGLNLDMLKPFEGHNVVEFTLEPVGAGHETASSQAETTKVTWAMSGPQALIPKLMGVVMNMDKMVGGQFAEGLANLKRVVESRMGR